MRYNIIAIGALILSLVACGEEKVDPDETSIPKIEDVSLSRDSLRIRYHSFKSSQNDWLPSKRVREVGKVYPVDEALLDTSFFVFREQLRAAVKQKDIFFIMEHIAEQVESGFEGEEGVAAFVQNWDLQSSEKSVESKIWPILNQILPQGGVFFDNKQQFFAPYYIANFPEDYDAQRFGVVLGAGVRVRQAPNLDAPVLRTISNEVVEIQQIRHDKQETIQGETFPWVSIRMLDDSEGFIWGKFIGQASGYHIIFTKKDKWKIKAVLAGN